MKKLWITGIALSLALCGCTATKSADETRGEEGTQAPVINQIALDAAEQRAEYYQQLAASLEDEVLSVKTEMFASRVEYEARIDDLEEQLAEVLAQKNQDTSNNTGSNGNGGNGGNGGNSGNGGNGGNASTAPESTPTPSEPEEDPYADFQFTVENGRATLTCYTGSKTEVTIPATYQGSPVVAIADRAFENKARISRVIIPDGVETVGWFAFSGCVSLKSATLPSSIRSISYGAFLNCNSSLVINCAKGSYAERYAQSYGIGTKN